MYIFPFHQNNIHALLLDIYTYLHTNIYNIKTGENEGVLRIKKLEEMEYIRKVIKNKNEVNLPCLYENGYWSLSL